MKKTQRLIVALLLSSSVAFVGCNRSSGGSNVSRATGWSINNKKGGFQYNTKYKGQQTAPGLVFIEGGSFTKGRVQDDIMHDWNNTPTQQNVQSFYMDETEVTNLMYLEYLDWLKRVFGAPDSPYRLIYEAALPDTLVWRSSLGFNEDMVKNYLRHPAFQNNPVVGVSWNQAVNFAKWRTERVNEKVLEREGYLKRDITVVDSVSSESGKDKKDINRLIRPESTFNTELYLTQPRTLFGDSIINYIGKNSERQTPGKKDSLSFAGRESGILFPEYRLPTETEWEYAALALSELREYNLYRGKKKYPWDGEYTRSNNKRTQGDQLANFKQGKGDYSGIQGWSSDGADITAPVMSYPPNDFGLYDMSGNVTEWVADVYRPIIDDEANDFNYYRGNVFQKTQINKEGKTVIIESDEFLSQLKALNNNPTLEKANDSVTTYVELLPNGKINVLNFPGEIVKENVDKEDTSLRTNYFTADNRDYRDGDSGSKRDDDNAKMYNAPDFKPNQKDESGRKTSLISNKVRVIKGGSWRDRAFWLDPAQRRFLPEFMATDYIGFRCAMSYLGQKPQKKKPRG